MKYEIGDKINFGPHKGIITAVILTPQDRLYEVSYFDEKGGYKSARVYGIEINKQEERLGFGK